MQPGSCRVAATSSLIVASASFSFPSATRIFTTSTNAMLVLLPSVWAIVGGHQPGQAVDRYGVVLGHVGVEQPVAALVREPGEPLRPLAGVRQQRNAVPARVSDPL